ncbi:YiiX/YebB-like N1pC/P60 family cysteine hydrolase, partial [Fusobacterium sp.]
KTLNPIGMFGHAAIMKNDRVIVDYPKFGNKSYTIDIEYWLEEGRDILVLRYKDMTDEFKKRLVKNMEKYFGKDYKIHFNKLNTDGFYCSQYIWYIYYITAQEMGFELDLDSDGGNFVLPYDFINSPYLEIVN